jgi:DNA-binding CsgD family transcriptional regulator
MISKAALACFHAAARSDSHPEGDRSGVAGSAMLRIIASAHSRGQGSLPAAERPVAKDPGLGARGRLTYPCPVSEGVPLPAGTGQVLCPILVGREGEVAEIEGALASARAGGGGFVILAGEAGIGKSRLTREAEQRARAAAMRVLRGRATSGGVPIPYRPFIEALHSALRNGGEPIDPGLAPYRGVLRAFMPETQGSAPEVHVLLIQEAVGRLLASVARRDGALLVLEDLHWADGDALALVEYLADNLAEDRVACLCTLRDESGPALDLVESLAARRAGRLLRLERLSHTDVELMTRAALGIEAVPGDLLDALRNRAEGVPFVIEEMLTTYVASGLDARAPAALPHTFRELVRGRLARVDDRTRGILLTAAVIGRTFDWALLSDVSELPREQVLAALHEAVGAQLVVADPGASFEMPFGFRHALVREALIAELLPPELAELSARAADAIEDRFSGLPGEWCERVAQLRENAGDRTAAARHLQEAARRAVGRGALGSAIEMLEHARSLTTQDRWHTIGIDRQLIDVLSLAGRIDRLREIGTAASAFIDEKRRLLPSITLARGEVHLRIARAMAAVGDDAATEEHLAQARDYLQQTREKNVRAALKAFESQRALARGDLVGARACAADALAMGEDLRLGEVVGEALSVAGNAAMLSGDAQGARELFLRAREGARGPVQRLGALLDLGSAEALLDDSIDTLDEVRALAMESGALECGMRAELAIARALIDRFDLAGASTHAAACIETSRRYKLPLLSEGLVVEARCLALAGEPATAWALLDEAKGESDGAHLTRAVMSMLEEDFTRAREALRGVRFETGAALSVLLAAASGATIDPPPVAGAVAEGLLLHALAMGTRSHSVFADADARLARSPWWRHIARRLTAEAAIDAGWGDPGAWLGSSLAFFEAAGHDRNVQACRALLRRTGRPVPRKGRGDASVPEVLRARGVTSREMDVLRLVAQGQGNREIAGRLFLSHRTVESHVASLMRKLDAATRGELAATADRVDTPPTTG